jgi:FAD/FMN-containing dehydrogenase
MHLTVVCDQFNQEIYKAVEPFVFEYVNKLHGSVSAEHGIGFHKTKYLKYSKSPEAIALMKDLKSFLDPQGILNPYKVLPQN